MADEKDNGFDALAALKAANARNLPATFGKRSLPELKAMLTAERAHENRTTVVTPLVAEIEQREREVPALTLEDERRAYLGFLADRIAGYDHDPGEATTPEQRAEWGDRVLEVLTNPAPAEDRDTFARAVMVLAPLVMELERLRAKPPETLPPKPLHSEKGVEDRVKDFAALAFCDGQTVRFKVPVKPGEFTVEMGMARYGKAVTLLADKPAVSIDRIVAMDKAGSMLATRVLPVPLSGGGGRSARFGAGRIAFEV